MTFSPTPVPTEQQPVHNSRGNIVCGQTVTGNTSQPGTSTSNPDMNPNLNVYGNAAGDHYYHFSLAVDTTVTFDACSSEYDTVLHVLNPDLSWTGWSNDDSRDHCDPRTRSWLQLQLPAGDYAMLIEGSTSLEGVYSVTMMCSQAAAPTTPVSSPPPTATPLPSTELPTVSTVASLISDPTPAPTATAAPTITATPTTSEQTTSEPTSTPSAAPTAVLSRPPTAESATSAPSPPSPTAQPIACSADAANNVLANPNADSSAGWSDFVPASPTDPFENSGTVFELRNDGAGVSLIDQTVDVPAGADRMVVTGLVWNSIANSGITGYGYLWGSFNVAAPKVQSFTMTSTEFSESWMHLRREADVPVGATEFYLKMRRSGLSHADEGNIAQFDNLTVAFACSTSASSVSTLPQVEPTVTVDLSDVDFGFAVDKAVADGMVESALTASATKPVAELVFDTDFDSVNPDQLVNAVVGSFAEEPYNVAPDDIERVDIYQGSVVVLVTFSAGVIVPSSPEAFAIVIDNVTMTASSATICVPGGQDCILQSTVANSAGSGDDADGSGGSAAVAAAIGAVFAVLVVAIIGVMHFRRQSRLAGKQASPSADAVELERGSGAAPGLQQATPAAGLEHLTGGTPNTVPVICPSGCDLTSTSPASVDTAGEAAAEPVRDRAATSLEPTPVFARQPESIPTPSIPAITGNDYAAPASPLYAGVDYAEIDANGEASATYADPADLDVAASTVAAAVEESIHGHKQLSAPSGETFHVVVAQAEAGLPRPAADPKERAASQGDNRVPTTDITAGTSHFEPNGFVVDARTCSVRLQSVCRSNPSYSNSLYHDADVTGPAEILESVQS